MKRAHCKNANSARSKVEKPRFVFYYASSNHSKCNIYNNNNKSRAQATEKCEVIGNCRRVSFYVTRAFFSLVSVRFVDRWFLFAFSRFRFPLILIGIHLNIAQRGFWSVHEIQHFFSARVLNVFFSLIAHVHSIYPSVCSSHSLCLFIRFYISYMGPFFCCIFVAHVWFSENTPTQWTLPEKKSNEWNVRMNEWTSEQTNKNAAKTQH